MPDGGPAYLFSLLAVALAALAAWLLPIEVTHIDTKCRTGSSPLAAALLA